MGLPHLSVKRPIAIFMVMIGIVLMGAICLMRLPVELMPNISFGEITIFITVRGGIPSSEIEESVAKPIEEAVGMVTHIKNILTISKKGECLTVLEFEPGSNMDFAALEVRERLARIRDKLPPEIERPVIAQYEYTDVPIVILAVTGTDQTPEELRKLVDFSLRDRFARIEGVAKVEVSGGRERKILVELDQASLQAHNLSISNVIQSLNLNNINLLAGDVEKEREKYLLRAMGEFETLDEIGNIGIALSPQGTLIRVKDVGEVKDSYLEATSFARMNIRPVVSLYVQKETLANTIKVADSIQKELDKIVKEEILPGGVEIYSTFNRADFIRKAVDTVKGSLLYGAILAILILAIFLSEFAKTRIFSAGFLAILLINNFIQLIPQTLLTPLLFGLLLVILAVSFFLKDLRVTFVVALTIPISVMAAFILMYFFKISLNVMSLTGLALGVGMLVDNSIVILENIMRLWEERIDEVTIALKNKIAIEGAGEMTLAIFASTITTLVVFLPLWFVNVEIRMLYGGLALSVTFSLLASLFVALSLVPILSSRFLGSINPTVSSTTATATGPLFIRTDLLSRLKEKYRKELRKALDARWVLILVCLLILAYTLFASRKLETEFIGVAEQNRFTVFIQMPTGTRLDISDKIVAEVEKIVSEEPDIKTATSRVEPWSSRIFVELRPAAERNRSASEIIESLRPKTEKLYPAFIYFEEPEEVGTKEILLELFGYDYRMLKDLAIKTARALYQIPGLTDIKIRMREGEPEMRVRIDKQKAAFFGLNIGEISEVLHAQMRGLIATRYHTPVEPFVRLKETSQPFPSTALPLKEEEKVKQEKMKEFLTMRSPLKTSEETTEVETIARLEEKYRESFSDLYHLVLVTPTGQQVYLEQISDFDFGLGPSEIWRKNKSRMVQVSANTGGMALGTVANKVKDVLSSVEFPEGYFWRIGGNYDKMVTNQKQLTFAICLAILLVYMVLASLFESFYQPFIIMFSVAFAPIGVVIVLNLTHTPVGLGVFMGCAMLVGVVVNPAIIMIDRINSLYRGSGGRKLSIRDAIITACRDRLRPILMTTSTTVLGLLPVALDRSEAASLWSPVAITFIGGLIVSTVFVLFLVPCIYLAFEDIKRLVFRRK